MKSRLALAMTAAGLLATPIAADDGDLDPGFWEDGRVVFAQTGDFEGVALTEAPDERIVVAGTYAPAGENTKMFWHAVSDSAATPLCTFPLPGDVTNATASAATFDREGRLLLAGGFRFAGGWRFAIARFLYPACTLDVTFDGNGLADYPVPGGTGYAKAIAVDDAGRIAIGGFVNDGEQLDLAVALVNGNGSLIGPFSFDGWQTHDTLGEGLDDVVESLLFDPSGRLVLGVDSEQGDFEPHVWFAIALELTGDVDPDFGIGGFARVEFPSPLRRGATLGGLALDPGTSALVLAGTLYSEVDSGTFPGLARLQSDGDLDFDFGIDGLAVGVFAYGLTDVHAIAIDGLSRIAVTGSFLGPGAKDDFDGFAARYTPDGALDPEFSGDGWVRLSMSGNGSVGSDSFAALATPSGRILLAGDASVTDSNDRKVALARLGNRLIFADGFATGATRFWSNLSP